MSQLILFLVRPHLLNLINNMYLINALTTQVQISVCLSVFLVRDILLGQCSIPLELCSASTILQICWKIHLSKNQRSCFLVVNKNPSFELPTNEKVAKRGTTNNTPAVPPVNIKCIKLYLVFNDSTLVAFFGELINLVLPIILDLQDSIYLALKSSRLI